MPRLGKAFNLYLDDEDRKRLQSLADGFRRSLHEETLHAIARHLAEPPVAVVPPLRAATVQQPQAKEPAVKRGRGRPPKEKPKAE